MASAQRGDQNDYGDFASFDPTSNLPPPLRPPNLSSEQVIAAVRLGFSDKSLPTGNYVSSNGRGSAPTDDSGFPQIGTFSLDDCVDGQNNQTNYYQQEEQEGLLPALRRPHVNEVPADVMAVLLKTSRCEQILAPAPNQNQPQGQRMNMTDGGRQNYSPSQSTNRTNNSSNNYHQQYNNYQTPPRHQTPPQQFSRPAYGQGDMRQRSPQSVKNGSGPPSGSLSTPASSAGRQSNVRVHLSASAKEFIPSTSNSAMMTTQEESELAQAVAQFQFQTQNQSQESVDFNNGAYANETEQPVAEENSDYVLSTVTDAIMDLTNHPANFNRCAKLVTDVLKKYCSDLDTMGVVVTLLCEQCISNPNFCYSGTRLAALLIKSGITVNKVAFKRLLLTRCQEEFQACLAKMQSDPVIMQRSRGMLMYFAELFMNIRNDNSSPITVLGLGVLEMMQNLVKDPAHENIKCVFQVLKLVGWELDISKDAKIKSNFEQLMKDMSYLCLAASNISPQTKQLLDILFELKNKKWNREDPEQAVKQCPSPASSTSGQSTVSSTHSHNTIYELPDSDEDDEDDCILLDDEPEEVQKAYEEFLKTLK